MFMLCLAIILHVHCIHLARGMMRMRTPSNIIIVDKFSL